MTGGKVKHYGPRANRSAVERDIHIFDRYRGRDYEGRGSSNLLPSRVSSPGTGPGVGGGVFITRADVLSTSTVQTAFDFSGTDVDGFANSSANIDVHLNGILLEKGASADYTVSSDTITLTTAVGEIGAKVTVRMFEVQ